MLPIHKPVKDMTVIELSVNKGVLSYISYSSMSDTVIARVDHILDLYDEIIRLRQENEGLRINNQFVKE
jgi:hypothetical protein